MKTSTVAWTLTALIVIAGIAWYVYANTTPALAPTTVGNTPVVTGSGPDYAGGDMMPTPTTPIASSTVTSSTTIKTQ